MKGFLKTLAAAAIGGAATGAAAVASSTDPVIQGKAALTGAITAAACLWTKQQPKIPARGVAALGLAVIGGAAQVISNGGAVDPQSLLTLAVIGGITGAFAGQAVKSPGQ